MKTFTFLAMIAGASALAFPPFRSRASSETAPAAPASNCTAVQNQLAAGIRDNLDIQAQELAGVHALQFQSGTAGFEKQQQDVLSIQQKGIAIRTNNQKLAAEINSPAAAGLATVAAAQTKEIMQVMSLKGTAADNATLTALVQEVRDGTAQNEKNLVAAQGQVCGK